MAAHFVRPEYDAVLLASPIVTGEPGPYAQQTEREGDSVMKGLLKPLLISAAVVFAYHKFVVAKGK